MGTEEHTSETTSSNRPLPQLEPYTHHAGSEANRLYRTHRPEFYPGKTYADFSPQTERGLGLMEARATAGSPVTREAQGLMEATLRGDYLDPSTNPNLERTFNLGAEAVKGNVASSFIGSGRYGSPAHAASLSTGLSHLADQVYGGNYQAERGRQMTAMGLSPGIAGMDYADIDRLLLTGARREGLEEAKIKDAMARHDFYENRDEMALDRYIQRLAGNPGYRYGVGTQQTPYYTNDAMGWVGTILSVVPDSVL